MAAFSWAPVFVTQACFQPAANVGPTASTTHDGGASSTTHDGGASSTTHDGAADGFVTGEGPSTTVHAGETVPAALAESLQAAEDIDGEKLRSAYPAPSAASVTYDPTQAAGLDLIQKSSMALSSGELEKLRQNGFVISSRTRFPTFRYGYRSIYAEDLPVYVSVDSVLEAVHSTYEQILEWTEEWDLVIELTDLLQGMQTNLKASGFDSETFRDLDVYLAVAQGLLVKDAAPLDSANQAEVQKIVGLAKAASGHGLLELFGAARDEDFSQFEPRGHYVDSEILEDYFRAMTWLGRVDMRIVETQSDGSQAFHRRQFDAAVALRQLLGESERSRWAHMDEIIGAFVGEHDSMTVDSLDGLLGALGKKTLDESRSLADQTIIDEIARGGWGAQRIASRIMISGVQTTLPLDRTFALFSQRYTVDSNVFVNVTYDRVPERMMPNPLDAAFAALGNNAALSLLTTDLENVKYAQALARTRALVDAHEGSYWEGSLYTQWLAALRALSPSPADASMLPSIAQTDGWQRRMLNSQLASWAELRHDTILYAKQSYTESASCEFPDAYVDPYPEAYAYLGRLAQKVGEIAQKLPASMSGLEAMTAWPKNFGTAMSNLQKMAENQRAGTPHSAELLAFVNEAVRWDYRNDGCGGGSLTDLSGWYLRLFLWDSYELTEDPTVADVHTQPTDGAGVDVGRILHVGTGDVRSMIVTIETCHGPRAYAGLTSSYGETITKGWQRLTDEEWASRYVKVPPQSGTGDPTIGPGDAFPDPPWMTPILAE